MEIKKYSDYSKVYESRLLECDFLKEQNITIGDIVNPLEDIITEEFIGKWIKDKAASGNKLAAGALKVGQVAKNIAAAVSKVFTSVFKSFGLDKLTNAIKNYIKDSKIFKSIKEGLSSLAKFAVETGCVDENNRPNTKRIWQVICDKSKSLISDSGVSSDDLNKAGNSIPTLQESSNNNYDYIINEDKYDISDEEVKYYGFFVKVAHALGIKNARFNGVVSQIMQKGTIGVAIMTILKISGFSLASLTGGVTLGPVALAAIGGMLLMAGLIILAIWICKPYPTVDDCLAYLNMYFKGNLNSAGINVIFTIVNPNPDVRPEVDSPEKNDVKSIKSMYPTMIKNLKALQSMLISFDGVKLEGSDSNKSKSNLEVGKLYYYTNKEGVTRKVKLISLTHDIGKGDDKKWLTKDDVKMSELDPDKAQVIYPDKEGKYSQTSTKVGVLKSNLKPVSESLYVKKFSDLILEKEFTKQPRNITVTKNEDYLTQAFNKIEKSIKVIKDEKDKGIGITEKFIADILDKKMESKDVIKSLYFDIYEHLYGKYAKTIPDLGELYKESIDIISKSDKRKVVAEKIARLAKRTLQFEGQNFYGGLGEFGADMEEFNITLKQIMDSVKMEKSED